MSFSFPPSLRSAPRSPSLQGCAPEPEAVIGAGSFERRRCDQPAKLSSFHLVPTLPSCLARGSVCQFICLSLSAKPLSAVLRPLSVKHREGPRTLGRCVRKAGPALLGSHGTALCWPSRGGASGRSTARRCGSLRPPRLSRWPSVSRGRLSPAHLLRNRFPPVYLPASSSGFRADGLGQRQPMHSGEAPGAAVGPEPPPFRAVQLMRAPIPAVRRASEYPKARTFFSQRFFYLFILWRSSIFSLV